MGLKNRIAPPRPFTPEEASQWYKLLDAIESELGEAGITHTLFVDGTEGDNATAQVGSLVFKYETIQGALDKIEADGLDNHVVFVAPGTYIEDLEWPPTADNVTLQGSADGAVIITNATALSNTIDIVPTGLVTGGNLLNVAVANSNGNLAVNVDGNANPGSFSQGFRTRRCFFPLGNLSMTVVNDSQFIDIVGGDVDLSIIDCGSVTMSNCSFSTILDRYTAVPPTVPTSGRGTLAASATICNQLTVDQLAVAVFGKDTQIGTVVATLIDNASAEVGFVGSSGKIPGVAGVSVDVEFTLLNATHEVCRFDYAEIGGTVTVEDSGTSAFRAEANLRSAELLDQNGPHTAGDVCDMDLRGALFNQASLAVAGDGTIDRTLWVQTIAAGNSGTPVSWANGGGAVPYPVAPDFVGNECAAVGEMPIAITTKSATQVAYTKGASDGADVVVLAYRDYVA